jgi:hypothetical protein
LSEQRARHPKLRHDQDLLLTKFHVIVAGTEQNRGTAAPSKPRAPSGNTRVSHECNFTNSLSESLETWPKAGKSHHEGGANVPEEGKTLEEKRPTCPASVPRAAEAGQWLARLDFEKLQSESLETWPKASPHHGDAFGQVLRCRKNRGAVQARWFRRSPQGRFFSFFRPSPGKPIALDSAA